ncbi:unannotated protein [freshwater metagenome]|uniref:Unannotated protein n=1 Tax=freshwater metagenome TaxID=449393 RepID=A0A6J7DIL0_9ZZZZ
MQQCPSCGGQLLSCDCRFDEDGDDDDDFDDDFDDDDDDFDDFDDDDIPPGDLTVVNGIPCTTALRTLIDLAPEVEPDHLDRLLRDCLHRRLFTVAEAHHRLSEPDMAGRRGAQRLRVALGGIE